MLVIAVPVFLPDSEMELHWYIIPQMVFPGTAFPTQLSVIH